VDFPKVHDIETIVGLMPAETRPDLAPEDQRKLTDYATIIRYPGGYEPPTQSDAVRAVELARKVREVARKRLGL
jgi:HEPN domain-containing protein